MCLTDRDWLRLLLLLRVLTQEDRDTEAKPVPETREKDEQMRGPRVGVQHSAQVADEFP